jgi:hypothetical protein
LPPSAEPAREPAARLDPTGPRPRPLSWAILVLAAAATVIVFLAVDSRSHSVSDTFYGMVVPEGIVVAVTAVALALVRGLARRRA